MAIKHLVTSPPQIKTITSHQIPGKCKKCYGFRAILTKLISLEWSRRGSKKLIRSTRRKSAVFETSKYLYHPIYLFITNRTRKSFRNSRRRNWSLTVFFMEKLFQSANLNNIFLIKNTDILHGKKLCLYECCYFVYTIILLNFSYY